MEGRIDRSFALAAALLISACAPAEQRLAQPLQLSSAQVAGDRLAYAQAGRGTPLLFVHGGFQDYRMWLPFLPAFAAEHRVIAYSRRNHFPNSAGPNGTPDGAADRHADDLAQLVHGLGLGPVHLVAHSSGAHTALFFAARCPGMVRSMVLIEPPAAGLLTAAPADQAALADFARRFGDALAALRRRDDGAAVRLFADAVGGAGTYERRTSAQKAMMMDNIAAHVADANFTGERPSFTCAMARGVAAPVLLINGTRSPPFFHRIADRLAECLPNEQRLAIDSSHTVPGENPAAFQRALASFLERRQMR